MKIYLDLIILINYFYDFLILLATSILLKRITNLKRIFLASLVGSLSIITLFISFDGIMLFLFKIILSIMMVLMAFGKVGFFSNIFYFYIITVILGGSSYLIGNEKNLSNVILLLIVAPIIITLYIINSRKIKRELSTIYDVILIDKLNTIKLRGFLDTGNNIKCHITNLPVIMVNENVDISEDRMFLVPYETIDHHGVIKCFKIDNVIVEGKKVKCLIGKSPNVLENEVLLNNLMREMIE